MFSKYDVYVSVQSIYCYKNSNVLKNKLNIRDNELLKQAEEEFSTRRAIELAISPISGRFSLSHLLNIHNYLFADVYYFAGKIRREDIFKGETRFVPNHLIRRDLKRQFDCLKKDEYLTELGTDEFIDKLAFYMAELNIIHPFREGNGRAIREFIRELALRNGYLINWANVDKTELLDASIESVYDSSMLIDCLKRCTYKLSEPFQFDQLQPTMLV